MPIDGHPHAFETPLSPPPPWSDLPSLPLDSISTRLPTLADLTAFRRVCSTWRSAAASSLPSQPPHLCSVSYDRLYSPSQSRFLANSAGPTGCYAVGFSAGHLVLADSSNVNRLSLADPVTGRVSRSLPEAPRVFSRTVIVSGEGGDAAMLVAFNSTGMEWCRLGDGGEWEVYEFPTEEEEEEEGGIAPIRNMGALGERLFGLTVDGDLVEVDIREPKLAVTFVEGQRLPLGRFQGTWLGACGNDLVVVTCTYKLDWPRAIDGFVVRRYNFREGTWEKVRSLGGRALFVDMSWGVLSEEVKAWGGKEDCVYFTDPMKNTVGMFNLKDGRMEELVQPHKTGHGDGEFRWDLAVWILPSPCH